MNNHQPTAALVIRPASFSDIPHIQNIVAATWPPAYSAILSGDQLDYMINLIYSHDALEEQIKNKHYFYLALQNFKPVGFASFSHVVANTYKLQKLYVLPGIQKTGAGKALLNMVETVAKSMGANKLQLNVNRKNIARSFYEKNGFSIVKEDDIDIGNGYFMNDYIMEKRF